MADQTEPQPGEIEVFIDERREPRICEKIEVPRGLMSVIVDTTGICEIQQRDLSYRGHKIDILVRDHSFEEVAYLLLYGSLPNRDDLSEFRSQLLPEMELREEVTKILKDLDYETPPIEVLRTAVSVLAHYDDDSSHDDDRASPPN